MLSTHREVEGRDDVEGLGLSVAEKSPWKGALDLILAYATMISLVAALLYLATVGEGRFLYGFASAVALCLLIALGMLRVIYRDLVGRTRVRPYDVERKPFLLLLGPFDRQLADEALVERKGTVMASSTHDYEEVEFEVTIPNKWTKRFQPIEALVRSATDLPLLKIGGLKSEHVILIDAPATLWRHTFSTLVRSATGVLMVPGTSPGLLAELADIRDDPGLSRRTLVLQPPGAPQPNYDEAREMAGGRGGVVTPPRARREQAWERLATSENRSTAQTSAVRAEWSNHPAVDRRGKAVGRTANGDRTASAAAWLP